MRFAMTDLRIASGLSKYLAEIYRIPLLTYEEETMYAKMKSEGNLNAAKILINSHLRLVVKIAYKYENYGLPIMDLISEGNIGLMKAVKEFDLSKGCRLVTYAMWWIKASIQDFILKSWSLVKIGTTAAQKKLFFNLQKIKNRIFSAGQKELTRDNINYISNVLDVSENEVRDMEKRLSHRDVYLNKKTHNNDDNIELIELIRDTRVDPETFTAARRERKKMDEVFKHSLSVLSDREREILFRRRLSEEQATLQDLSKVYGISSERIRQIEDAAVKKLKEFAKLNYKN